jgi:hypothetical protein
MDGADTHDGRTRALLSRRNVIIAVSALILLGVAAGFFIYKHNTGGTEVPPAVTALSGQNKTKIFFPAPLPRGVSVSARETARDGDVLMYVLLYKSQRIAVSSQPKPSGVIFNDFYTRLLQHKADVFNQNGKAVVLEALLPVIPGYS